MNKHEAFHAFLEGNGIKAFCSGSVPSGEKLPYMTYQPAWGAWGSITSVPVTIWHRTSSDSEINKMADTIVGELKSSGTRVQCEEGVLLVRPGQPFVQAIETAEDGVKARYINLEIEFMTI